MRAGHSRSSPFFDPGLAVLLAAALWCPLGAAAAQPPQDTFEVRGGESPMADEPVPGASTIVGHTFFPERREFSEDLLERIRLPEGFRIGVFATELENPRMMALGPDGAALYVTRPEKGDVLRLADSDGDGRADERETVVEGIPEVHGIAIDEGRLFLADINHVYVAELNEDGGASEPREIISGLPDGGQHANRTLRMGPEGWLYITVGSLTNAVPAPDSLEAAMLRAQPDGSELQIFARNLRNTLGFGWHPVTGDLWAMDHGIDWLGDDVQPEELNRIEEDGDYGWPFCYGAAEPNPARPAPGSGATEAEEQEGEATGANQGAGYCAGTKPMALGYTAHAAPMDLAFYTGDAFPEEYRNDAFVAMRGSWNRYPPSGYEVVRIRFDPNGEPRSIEPFATGWLLQEDGAHFGRLVGLAVTEDGHLLVGDDTNGVIYRITYEGGPADGG